VENVDVHLFGKEQNKSPLSEALREISFNVLFLHKERFGSSTTLMHYKYH